MTVVPVSTNVSIQREDGLDLPGFDDQMNKVARQLADWVQTTRGGAAGTSLFTREKYVSTDKVYDQTRLARQALRDDEVVAGVAEMTEGLAFQGILWESKDFDTQDLFNQMAAEQNLDDVVRKIWREEGSVGAVHLAFWWDSGTFTIRGKTDKGNARKTTKTVWFPRLITVLDPEKVVPVGMLNFGQERLAWRATAQEMAVFNQYLIGQYEDDLMDRFYVDRYQVPDQDELNELTAQGIDTSRLILLSGDNVRRHTTTRSDYERWAPVRLRSVFRLLDLKQQLMEADRVSLVGAANYILLVKKGDKDNPAHPEEITNLKANYHTLAKIPVIFSDHRLSVEIITPKQDFVLQSEKYNIIDGRIVARLLSAIPNTNRGRADEATLLGRPTARALEGRRHMQRRFLERELARAVVDHPKNAGIFPAGAPSLSFNPPSIHIDLNPQELTSVLALRTQRELSRESVLQYFGFDQQVEAMRRELEEQVYDDIFKTQVPFSSPQGNPPADQAGAGAQGGRPAGGGTRTQNPTKTATTKNGNTAPGSQS